MSRVSLASDTCNIYFTYTKVNHLLYTCSLDPFEDGILLDTPLVCMHRYCWSFTDDEEECKHQGTTIREGSMEEKEEEAWTSFWKAWNFRPLPGTSGNRNLRPSQSFWPCCTDAVRECANSLDSPDPARTFRPSPELPALPARRHSGRSPCTLSPLTYPFVATTI